MKEKTDHLFLRVHLTNIFIAVSMCLDWFLGEDTLGSRDDFFVSVVSSQLF
jgi:hypothetical protein